MAVEWLPLKEHRNSQGVEDGGLGKEECGGGVEGHNWVWVTSVPLACTAPTSPGLAAAGHREYVLATQMGFECRKGRREDCRKISKHPHCRGGCTVGRWQDRGSGLVTKVPGCHGRMIGL